MAPTPATVAPSIPTDPSATSSARAPADCFLLPSHGCLRTGRLLAPAVPRAQVGGPTSWLNLTPPTWPSSYPGARFTPNLAYDPTDRVTLLFGGVYQDPQPPYNFTFYQDTWAYANGVWTSLIPTSGCTATSCPPARAFAQFAYDTVDREAVLLGGLSGEFGVLNDTWVFAGGAWTNLTSSLPSMPQARFDGSMTYDTGDGYVLLFGGANATDVTLGDTWTFVHGTWRELTGTLLVAPEPRAGASLADSPTGYVMLFGGEDEGVLLQNNCLGGLAPWLAWWFQGGTWTAATKATSCPPRPSPAGPPVFTAGLPPPCGRVNAALGWSPKNDRFVLFGGYGSLPNGSLCPTSAAEMPLNDTWLYEGTPGGPFYPWYADVLPGAPSPRYELASASDFEDGYFLTFGGLTTTSIVNETWRYYAAVTAHFAGPLEIQTGQLGLDVFTLNAYGGSGVLDFQFAVTGLRNSNTLTGNGCGAFDGSPYPVPASGTDVIPCVPDTSSYNIYRLSVTVWDTANTSARAYANWTVTVSPPEVLKIYSEYKGYFYEGFSVPNIFGVYAELGGGAPTSVTGTLDTSNGLYVSFTPANASGLWWNSTQIDMGSVVPGGVLEVTATYPGWTENASYPISIIATPDWLGSLVGLTKFADSFHPTSPGPFNRSYYVLESFELDFQSLFNFSIPVPLVGGNYSLFPDLQVVFNESSSGSIQLTGNLTLKTPSIDFGPATLTLSAAVSVQGQFALQVQGTGVSGITWQSASITLTIAGDFKLSVPIYGFSFNFLGLDVKIGFNLDIEVTPAVALTLLLTPTTVAADDILQNLGLAVSELLASFSLPLSVDLSFGIGIASVSAGGMVSLALAFELAPTPSLSGGWVNGSIFTQAQFLFWKTTGYIAGPGVIYSWGTATARPNLLDGLRAPGRAAAPSAGGPSWSLTDRYYNTSGYDRNVWAAGATQGPAVSDIYPSTTVTAAAASDGAYLFYANDLVALPVQTGLTVSALRLDAASNQLQALPAPYAPGNVITNPRAMALPDGTVFVAWNSLPASEVTAASPSDLTSVGVQGAVYDPATRAWGPAVTYPVTGFASGIALDDGGAGGDLLALVTPGYLPDATSPEQLVEFNRSTGAQVASTGVVDLARIVSFRAASHAAVVETFDGHYFVVDTRTGAPIPIAAPVPAGANVTAEQFVPGSPSLLLLRDRGRTSGEAILFDLARNQTAGVLPLGGDVSDVQALAGGGVIYLFAADATGVQGWTMTGGTFLNLSISPVQGIHQIDLVQVGRSVLVYSIVSDANATEPTRGLYLLEIAAQLPAIAPGTGGSSPGTGGAAPTSDTPWLILVGVLGLADLLILAAVVFRYRRRAPSAPPSGAVGDAPPSRPPEG